MYRSASCFWRRDGDGEGFRWIDASDAENCVLSYVRTDGQQYAVVVCNLTPTLRENYRIGVPDGGNLHLWLSSDESRFGGSGFSTPAEVATDSVPCHGLPQSARLQLPPLAVLIFGREPSPTVG